MLIASIFFCVCHVSRKFHWSSRSFSKRSGNGFARRFANLALILYGFVVLCHVKLMNLKNDGAIARFGRNEAAAPPSNFCGFHKTRSSSTTTTLVSITYKSSTMSASTDPESADYVEASSEGGHTTARKSMTFLGICDFRIATMFVNGLNLAMILVGVLVAAIRGPLFFKSIVGAFAIGLPGIALSSLGLYGANKFELWAMYLATAGFLVATILDGILMNWLGFAVTLIVLIPHVILTFEMRNGIMTPETYINEEFLVPQGRDLVDKASSYMTPQSSTDTTPQE
jgi:hypothetical protein